MKDYTVTICLKAYNQREILEELKEIFAKAETFSQMKVLVDGLFIEEYDEEELLGPELSADEKQAFEEEMKKYVDEDKN